MVRPSAAESSARNHCVALSRTIWKNSRTGAAARIERVERAESGDQGEHVALDRDVLATRPALEQQDEAESEHDQGCRRGGAAGFKRASKDGVDQKEGEDRAERRRHPGGNRECGEGADQAAAIERTVRWAPGRARRRGCRSSRRRRGSGGGAGRGRRSPAQRRRGSGPPRRRSWSGRGDRGDGCCGRFAGLRRPPPGGARIRRSSRTTSATPLVTCVPEPIATAIRARFSAGTSLTPSPIIAV